MVHVKQVCQEQEVRVNYKGDCEELGWRQLETGSRQISTGWDVS